jgi:hypothetical protein
VASNKTDRHDIAELLLKVALNTINLNLNWNLTFVLIKFTLEMLG